MFRAQLPGYRGAVVFIRLINDNKPLGVTCHWAHAKVDVGPIVDMQALPVHRGDSLSDVMHGIVTLAARLMTEAISRASAPDGIAALQRVEQGPEALVTPCYRWPEDELVAGAMRFVCLNVAYAASASLFLLRSPGAKKKLEDGTYGCYASD
jgi:methionyl-tRNA formyltransferase